VSQTISFILGMVIVPIWLFYIMNDIFEIKRGVYYAFPEAWREDVRHVVRIVDNLLSAYLRVQLILCLAVGVLSLIALMIIGVDLAVLLATFAGVFEVIPVLGPYLGAIPALLVVVFVSPIKALWVAISFFAIQQIENTLLVPRITGHAVRLHPAVVMVVMVVASQIAGLWGLLLAVPVTALVRDVYRYLYLRTLECGATPDQAMACLLHEIEG
jgi:predicted PurR-regulated permease PerM